MSKCHLHMWPYNPKVPPPSLDAFLFQMGEKKNLDLYPFCGEYSTFRKLYIVGRFSCCCSLCEDEIARCEDVRLQQSPKTTRNKFHITSRGSNPPEQLECSGGDITKTILIPSWNWCWGSSLSVLGITKKDHQSFKCLRKVKVQREFNSS